MNLIIRIINWPFKFIWALLLAVLGVVRGLLPPYIEIKEGDKFNVIKDLEFSIVTYWHAPMTDGFKAVIPKDCIVVAWEDSGIFNNNIMCLFENEESFKNTIIPADILNHPKFSGYSICLNKSDLGKKVMNIN